MLLLVGKTVVNGLIPRFHFSVKVLLKNYYKISDCP